VTIKEKKQLYIDAVDKNWMLFFEHDPDIVACTIQYDGINYKKNNIVKI